MWELDLEHFQEWFAVIPCVLVHLSTQSWLQKDEAHPVGISIQNLNDNVGRKTGITIREFESLYGVPTRLGPLWTPLNWAAIYEQNSFADAAHFERQRNHIVACFSEH